MATNTDECILLDKANQIYLFGWRGIIETFVFYIVFGGVSFTSHLPIAFINNFYLLVLVFYSHLYGDSCVLC